MEVKFWECGKYMYLQHKQDICVPSKMELRIRFLNPGYEIADESNCPLVILSKNIPVNQFIKEVQEAVIKSAQATVLPGAVNDLNLSIHFQGKECCQVQLHLYLGTRNIFIASSEFIAGYIMYTIFKNFFPSKTSIQLKELLGIPLDDTRYKF